MSSFSLSVFPLLNSFNIWKNNAFPFAVYSPFQQQRAKKRSKKMLHVQIFPFYMISAK